MLQDEISVTEEFPLEGTERELTSTRAGSPFHERGSLVSYLADIASTPTLTREQEVELAGALQSAGRAFRESILSVPWTAREVIRIWRERQANGLVTARLCESFGTDPGGTTDLGQRLDTVLARVERLIARRRRLEPGDEAREREIQRIDRRAAGLLAEADLAMSFLVEARTKLLVDRQEFERLARERADLRSPRRRPRSEQGRKRLASPKHSGSDHDVRHPSPPSEFAAKTIPRRRNPSHGNLRCSMAISHGPPLGSIGRDGAARGR